MLNRVSQESEECCSHRKCQAFVKFSMVFLAFLTLIQIILSALKGVFTRNISRAELVRVIMEAVLDSTDFDQFQNQLQLASISAALITVLGILFALFTLCAARFCH